jgi:DNA-binding MarR family transcriptional regulator
VSQPGPADTDGVDLVAGVDVVTGEVAASARDLFHALERLRLRTGRAVLDVGVTEMAALDRLFGADRTPTELADLLRLTTASVTGLVDRLAALDLVERLPHPRDRRRVIVTLTDRARAQFADVVADVVAATERALAGWDPELRARLAEGLRRLGAEYDRVGAEPARPRGRRLADTLARIATAPRSQVPDDPSLG